MVDDKQQNRLHAILVAYPLQGHVIPAVHLAIKLASKGFTITFINTDSIHKQITDNQTKDDKDDIFAAVRESAGLDIRYTTVSDGLPLGFDRSLNHDQFMAALLHVLSAHVDEAIERILKSDPLISCLVADTFFVFPGKLAKKYGLSYISFWTEPALVFSLYYHVDLLRSQGHFECFDMRDDIIDYIPGVQSIDPKDLTSYLQSRDTSTVCHKIIFSAFRDVKSADFVLCNTVQEFEPQTILALQKKKLFFPIGPLFPTGFTKSVVPTSLWSESDCTHWLGNKPRGSVLYVSFGSYAHLNKTDLVEIANGLSLSKVNFVWVIRPDIVSSDDADPLPEGFKENNSDRGMIIPWCLQIQVLSHPAIGGFLSHCGWNSILESIWCNVPLLCFPLLTDQFTNRRLVVHDWKVGLNICDKKPITSAEVSQKVQRLFSGKQPNEFRDVMQEVKKKMEDALSADGSSENNLELFIKDLKVTIQNKGRIPDH